jgi:hypothetical protein
MLDRLVRALWTGIAGIAIGVAGVVWDAVWHGRHTGIAVLARWSKRTG